MTPKPHDIVVVARRVPSSPRRLPERVSRRYFSNGGVGRRPERDLLDGLPLKLKTLIDTFGRWYLLYERYRVQKRATTLKQHYDAYPSAPVAFEEWRSERDRVPEEVYEIAGAETKY